MMDPKVAVLIPPVLAHTAGEQRLLTVPLAGAATVADVFNTLAGDYPVLVRRVREETGQIRRFVNVFLDGENVRALGGTETPVRAGQEILILQSVAGG